MQQIKFELMSEFCRRSTGGSMAFMASTIPLLLFPLITRAPYHAYYMLLVFSILPINLMRILVARKILSNLAANENLYTAHTLTIFLNALCYGLFIGLAFWTLPISSIGFIISIIILSAISSGSTSSLALSPFHQYGFLILVAILPTLELFLLSAIRNDQGYGLLASLISIFIAYVILSSRQYYEKMVKLFKYVQKLKVAQDEILTQKARADHASRLAAIGEMASGIAHEINNPLSIIQGHVKHLQILAEQSDTLDEASKTQFSERSEKIQNSVTRIGRIINGLKLFSQQRKTVDVEKIDFQKIINNTLELCEERFHLHNIDLMIDKSPTDEIAVNVAQITQVLHHLLINAFEAVINTERPKVAIRIEIIKDHLEIRISDNGKGVPIELRNRIFIPFFTSKEIGKGAGLGLSISKGIIEQHGGSLYLEENEDSGLINKEQWTTFVLTIPLA